MNIEPITTFQKAIDVVESFPIEDREELLKSLKIRMAEDRRDQIAANARETLKALKERRANIGSIDDLKKDLIDNDV